MQSYLEERIGQVVNVLVVVEVDSVIDWDNGSSSRVQVINVIVEDQEGIMRAVGLGIFSVRRVLLVVN